MVFPDVIVFFPLIGFPSAGFTPWSKNSDERGKGRGTGIVQEGKGKERKRKRKGKGKGKGKEKERTKKAKGKGKENERKRNGKGNEKGGKRKGKRRGKRKGEGERRLEEETGKRKGKGEERERKGRGKGEEQAKKGSVSHGPFLMPEVIVFVIVRESCVCVPSFSGNGCNHQKRSVATTYRASSLCRICAITTTKNERKRPKALNSRRMMEKSRTLDFKSLDTNN